jgi:transcriptional regulator with XRE-family HTH domain
MDAGDREKNRRILDVRRALGLTQAKFAAGLMLNQSYIGAIELGNRRVNDRIIRLVSMTYGTSEKWLKTGAGEMFDRIEDLRLEQIVQNFKKLDPLLQDYLLKQLDLLLDYQEKASRNAD